MEIIWFGQIKDISIFPACVCMRANEMNVMQKFWSSAAPRYYLG